MEKVTHDVTTLKETFLMAYIWKRSRPQNSQSHIDSGLTNAEMENWKGTATEHILYFVICLSDLCTPHFLAKDNTLKMISII